jgi:hypothetical protein
LSIAEELTRDDLIHKKGFDMISSSYNNNDVPVEYRKTKIGTKTVEDAVLHLGDIKNSLPLHNYTNKKVIYKALAENDIQELRHISNFYYNINGMYQRVCNYFAFLYRYDWYVVPEIYDESVKTEKVLKDYSKVLKFLDNSYIRKVCGDIALEAIKDGAYYGYTVPSPHGLVLQQLPINYCRSRYSI